MLRTFTLAGVAAAMLTTGCCWRPFFGSSSPALYNPPPAPLFPRLHPGYWAHPPAAATPMAAPAMPAGPAGPDCPGCVGSLPPGAVPYGSATLPPVAVASGPVTVSPPPGLLANGPQFSPTYFGPAATTPPAGSTQLPPPRAGDPPSAMPMNK